VIPGDGGAGFPGGNGAGGIAGGMLDVGGSGVGVSGAATNVTSLKLLNRDTPPASI